MNFSFPFLKNKQENQPLPKWLEEYKNGYKNQAAQLKQSVQATRFVVFDTETSGFNLKKDHLLSIGAIAVQGNCMRLTDAFEILLCAPSNNEREHVEIHQILPSTSVEGQDSKIALQQFVEFLGDDILVGHHVQFDISMVSHCLKVNYGVKLHNLTIDTAALAKRLENAIPGGTPVVGKNYTLDQLCDSYNVPTTDRHNAAGDAFITAQLFLKMLNKAEKRGIKTVDHLIEKKRVGLL